MPAQEATPSEKAADRMHADLDAMLADARRHRDHTSGEQSEHWHAVQSHIAQTRYLVTKCMSARDRRIAGQS